MYNVIERLMIIFLGARTIFCEIVCVLIFYTAPKAVEIFCPQIVHYLF